MYIYIYIYIYMYIHTITVINQGLFIGSWHCDDWICVAGPSNFTQAVSLRRASTGGTQQLVTCGTCPKPLGPAAPHLTSISSGSSLKSEGRPAKSKWSIVIIMWWGKQWVKVTSLGTHCLSGSGIVLRLVFSVLFFGGICSSVRFPCNVQHFGAGSCHFNGIATSWSSNLSFSVIFATLWCSNFSCWMVVCD